MNQPIPLTEEGFSRTNLKSLRLEPLTHYSMGDNITPEWNYQALSAGRFHSEELLNFFHLQQKYKPMMRLDLGRKILSEIPREQVILYTDAFDVLFNNSLASIYAYFLEIESDSAPDSFGRKPAIIFNGEKGCWPESHLATSYPESDIGTDSPFLNSGIMIGRCGAILDVLERKTKDLSQEEHAFWDDVYERTLKTDDQCFWNHAYLHSLKNGDLPRIHVDHDCRLACCMFSRSMETLAASNNIVFLKNTGVRPCLLHFNGPTKFGMKGVAVQLGYPEVAE